MTVRLKHCMYDRLLIDVKEVGNLNDASTGDSIKNRNIENNNIQLLFLGHLCTYFKHVLTT